MSATTHGEDRDEHREAVHDEAAVPHRDGNARRHAAQAEEDQPGRRERAHQTDARDPAMDVGAQSRSHQRNRDGHQGGAREERFRKQCEGQRVSEIRGHPVSLPRSAW